MKYLLTFFLAITSLVLNAQQKPKAEIKALARVKKDSIVLRFAPTTPIAWQLGNQYGYIIERYAVANSEGVIDTTRAPEKIRLTPNPIKPLPLDDWEPLVQGDDYAAVAAQALYGETFELTDPTENAGLFINQVTENENRFSFALFSADVSINAARGLGLLFVDTDFDRDSKYVYRVSLAGENPKYPVGHGSVFTDPQEIMKLPPPEDVKVGFGDRSVAINWNSFYHQRIYTSYIVERSDDEGKTFQRTQNSSFLNTRKEGTGPKERTYYVDSLPQNNKVYQFRVRGITPFGEKGPPSEAISGVGLVSAKGIIPVIESITLLEGDEVMVKWRYPKTNRNDIKGYIVARGNNDKGPFKNLYQTPLNTSASFFVDKKPDPVNYYVVKAITFDGQEVSSFPALFQLEDNTPPQAPQGLTGKVDTTGWVTLSWKPNGESDLLGYKVFRLNSLKEEPIQITGDFLRFSDYKDSINIKTLTRHVYYQVVAYDYRYNPSAYSEPLQLVRPDIVSPVATVFTRAESTDEGIYLNWEKSISKDADRYELFRLTQGETDSILVAEIPVSDKMEHYLDKNVEVGKNYSYQLYVIDAAGLQSQATTIGVTSIDSGIRTPVDDLKATVNKEGRLIDLGWEYEQAGVLNYIIYRSKDGGPIRRYKTLNASSKAYKDRALAIGGQYQYQIQVEFEDGAATPLSKKVSVVYE
ncbi:MAG: hypothetical protein AAFX87_13080 [Bacteroidota bacterium]